MIRVVTMEVITVRIANGIVMAIVDRVAPPDVIVMVCCIIARTVVKVQVGVAVPRAPFIASCVSVIPVNMTLFTVSNNVNVLYIELLAILGDNIHLKKAVVNVARSRNFNRFRAAICPQHECVTVTSFIGMFVIIAASCVFTFGITNPNTTGN